METMFEDATEMLANYPNLPRDGDVDPKEWSRYFPRKKPTKSARLTKIARSTDPNRSAGPGEGSR
jgi:hypothetical protein